MGSLDLATSAIITVMFINGLMAIPFGVLARRAFCTKGHLTPALATWSGIAMHGHALLTFTVAWLDRGSLHSLHTVYIIIGLSILIVGAVVIGLGRKAYGDQRRVYGLLEDQIIEIGIYRWSRNPQYLGYALMFLGASLATGSILALGFTLIFFVLIHAGITLIEEPHLKATFGTDYEDYLQRSARYFSIPKAASDKPSEENPNDR